MTCCGRPNSQEPSKTFLEVSLSVPKPHDVLDLTMSDGAIVRVRRHGNVQGPRVILSHGNGFAIDGYYPFWRLLLSDFEVVVYDQRNHGWNPLHQETGHTQGQMADDLETIIAAVTAFGERPTVGAFHSLSSTVSLLHYMKYRRPWAALVLFDPPLAPPPGHPLHKLARDFEFGLHDRALQRTSRFKSPEELAINFKRTRRMRRWVEGAAMLMACAITRPTADGGFELACPPKFEAEIYIQNSNAPAWSVLPLVANNLLVVSSDDNASDADAPGKVSRSLKADFGIQVVSIPDTGHLLQIERPEAVMKVVRDYLRTRGFEIGNAA
jgi:pimeloyl-ACP methyl ester carboxylesterase